MIAPAKPGMGQLLSHMQITLEGSLTVTAIESDSVTTSRAVHLNLASIRCEILRGIFCSDTALECKAAGGNVILGQTELSQGGASSDLNLRRYNVDTRDFLSDGMLDLTMKLVSRCFSRYDKYRMLARWSAAPSGSLPV